MKQSFRDKCVTKLELGNEKIADFGEGEGRKAEAKGVVAIFDVGLGSKRREIAGLGWKWVKTNRFFIYGGVTVDGLWGRRR